MLRKEERESESKTNLLMFLLGLGTKTRIVLFGCVSFSELAMFAAAPCLLLMHYRECKRLGIMPILLLVIAMMIGCAISAWMNATGVFYFVKNSAVYYSIFAMTTVFTWLLSRDGFRAMGWYVLGLFLSNVVTIFAFNPQVETSTAGSVTLDQQSVEDVVEGVMFWFVMVKSFFNVPIVMFYMKWPVVVSALLSCGGSVFAVLTSVSGRGAAALGFLGTALMMVGGRSWKRIAGIGRHFCFYLLAGLAAVVLIKNTYVYAAKAGLLGDAARNKYFVQSKGGSGFLSLLISGRTEFFVAIRAVLHHPIVGIGYPAVDEHGYYLDTICKYGDLSDIENFHRRVNRKTGGVVYVPQHSCVTYFWAVCGISGALFWIYVLYLMLMYFKRYAPAVPHWFGYMSLISVANAFTIFFNPYPRDGFPIMIAMILVSRAVYRGVVRMPPDVVMEIRENE